MGENRKREGKILEFTHSLVNFSEQFREKV